MSRATIWRRVVLPQAVRNVLPVWSSYYVSMYKATALLGLITVPDLLFKARGLATQNFRVFEDLLHRAGRVLRHRNRLASSDPLVRAPAAGRCPQGGGAHGPGILREGRMNPETTAVDRPPESAMGPPESRPGSAARGRPGSARCHGRGPFRVSPRPSGRASSSTRWTSASRKARSSSSSGPPGRARRRCCAASSASWTSTADGSRSRRVRRRSRPGAYEPKRTRGREASADASSAWSSSRSTCSHTAPRSRTSSRRPSTSVTSRCGEAIADGERLLAHVGLAGPQKPLPGAAVRRPAAARRDCPRARDEAEGHPVRRGHLVARSGAGRRGPRGDEQLAAKGRR